MSKTLSRTDAFEIISNWNISDVVSLLQKNGLDNCCKAVQKRHINGNEFLRLTEWKLALWKNDLTRSSIWSLWRCVEEVKKCPEKFVAKKDTAEAQSEDALSDTGSWGTDFEDDADDDETDDGISSISHSITTDTSKNNEEIVENISGSEINRKITANGQSTSRNSEFRNSLMIFRENEKITLSREKSENSSIEKKFSSRSNGKLVRSIDDAKNDERRTMRTYANCEKFEAPVVAKVAAAAAAVTKNVSNLHGKIMEGSLAEQLKGQLLLKNSKKPLIGPEPEIEGVASILKKSSNIEKREKSYLHDVMPRLQQQKNPIDKSVFTFVTTTTTTTTTRRRIDEEFEKIQSTDRTEMDLPRPPPMTIRNFDLVANLPTRTADDSEDEYETFDEEIIEHNKRLSLESVYKTPSTTSQDKQEDDDDHEIYECITETPEDNGYDLQSSDNEKTMQKSSRPLPAKPVILPSSATVRSSGLEKKSERSPDKKSATLPHSGSSTSLTAESRATRPLPPPPDGKSYMDQPWFHNVTRQQATAMIKDRSHNGYFLLRPSTSQPNNPFTLVLWFKDRVYNVPVRKRPDNRYALGTAKVNEPTFVSIEEIVKFYSREELLLYTGGVQTGLTKLTDTPPK